MKILLKKIYLKLGKSLGFIEDKKNFNKKVLYKIGNVKKNNSIIDSLIPQAIEIGDNFISGPNSMILAHDASTYNHIKMHRVEKVVIGDNVFLGAGAIVLPGVKINDGAIIGAGSIVTNDVASNAVVAGNPARYICKVEDYIKKCEFKNVLFDTPNSFDHLYEDKLTPEHVKEFQAKYLKEDI